MNASRGVVDVRNVRCVASRDVEDVESVHCDVDATQDVGNDHCDETLINRETQIK